MYSVYTLVIFEQLLILPFLCSGQVTWSPKLTEVRLNGTDTLELVCSVSGVACCTNRRRWTGGQTLSTLMLNGVSIDDNKYNETVNATASQFSLIIYNVNTDDLNVDYQCTYGFTSSPQTTLAIDRNFFRYVPQKSDIKQVFWTYNDTKFTFAANVTNVFPEPVCSAFFESLNLTSNLKTTSGENTPLKYAQISMSDVDYKCPGTLTISCNVGSYPFHIFTEELTCSPTTVTSEILQTSSIGSSHQVNTTATRNGVLSDETKVAISVPLGLFLVFVITVCVIVLKRRMRPLRAQTHISSEEGNTTMNMTNMIQEQNGKHLK